MVKRRLVHVGAQANFFRDKTARTSLLERPQPAQNSKALRRSYSGRRHEAATARAERPIRPIGPTAATVAQNLFVCKLGLCCYSANCIMTFQSAASERGWIVFQHLNGYFEAEYLEAFRHF